MSSRDQDEPVPWLDEFEPFEEEQSARQIEGVIELLRPAPKRIADLGCGAGRLLVPLAEEGHDLTGIDHFAEALERCRGRLARRGLDARLLQLDFLDPASWDRIAVSSIAPFDAILCVGNTVMTVVEIQTMLDLLRHVKDHLAPDGLFIIDDCCADFWPLLTEGNWQAGLNDAEDLQLLWHPSDTIFSLRRCDEVDASCWEIKPADRRFRLWTDGQLTLAARVTGLSAPARAAGVNLLTFRRENAR